MYKIIRVDPYGHEGYKYFKTKEEAAAWLDSDFVKEDIKYGYYFNIKEVENYD